MAHSRIFVLSVVLAACGGSTADSSGDQARRFQDMWEIDQIEKDFHQATTTKDIDLMMSLYAPNATMTVGPGETAAGLDEIRRFWLKDSAPFAVRERTGSRITRRTSSRSRSTATGARCISSATTSMWRPRRSSSITTADFDVARIDGKWLITNMVGGTTVLEV